MLGIVGSAAEQVWWLCITKVGRPLQEATPAKIPKIVISPLVGGSQSLSHPECLRVGRAKFQVDKTEL